MADGGDVELVEGREVAIADILGVLEAGYGRPFGEDWFRWKHVEGPWGPSRPVVARDAGGPLGVVFGLPWRYRVDGDSVDGIRLVDGATTPRALRRGVFGRIGRELIDPTNGSVRPPIVMATATPEAQGAHVKNGATAVQPIRSWYRLTRYSRAAVGTADLGADVPSFGVAGHVTTAWDAASLRWRIDRRSGARYQVAHLVHADARHGVVYRVGPRRTLLLTARWGPSRECATLLRAVAWRHRAVAVLAPAGAGTLESTPRAGVPRGRSLLCVWDRRPPPAPLDLGHRATWGLSGLDLEGYI
jgi:hypothetical protein